MYARVRWPERYHPRVSPLYALNDIDVAAPPEVVWRFLVDAENWKHYFPPENRVTITGGHTELRVGSIFSRFTVGYTMICTVEEHEAERRIAWSTTVEGDETCSTAYHGWVITPTDSGCHVLTEETQQGEFFLELLGRRLPGGIYSYHQDWVELLARAAESPADAAPGSAYP